MFGEDLANDLKAFRKKWLDAMSRQTSDGKGRHNHASGIIFSVRPQRSERRLGKSGPVAGGFKKVVTDFQSRPLLKSAIDQMRRV